MAHPSYLALVADLDDSRQLAAEARSQVQRSLLELSRKSQSWLGALPVAGPEVVSGDRMQALFPCPARRSEAERVAAAIADTVLLWAAEARRVSEGEAAFSFGLGCGSLSTAIDADRIGRMDGPCFHRAETALVEDAKRGKRFCGARGFGPPAGAAQSEEVLGADRALAGSFEAIGALIQSWTARQTAFVLATHRRGVLRVQAGELRFAPQLSRTEVATRFGVGLPTVSKSLASAQAHALPGVMYAAAWQLASIIERTVRP